MIFGVVDTERRTINREAFTAAAGNGSELRAIYPETSIALAYTPVYRTAAYRMLAPVSSDEGDIAVVFSGQIYNREELIALTNSGNGGAENLAVLIMKLYQALGESFVEKLNGKFAFAISDRRNNSVLLGRDRFGVEPLYYYHSQGLLVFASAIAPVVGYLKQHMEVHFPALCKFLLFGYNPGLDSFFKGIRKLRPGHLLKVGGATSDKLVRYWGLTFDAGNGRDEASIAEELRSRLQTAVSLRTTPGEPAGMFVSGGMDSSSVLGLAAGLSEVPPVCYSYRCRGESFDESPHARLMAKSVGSDHSVIEYSPEDVLSMLDVVVAMDEPFCDVGINIATYLLGQAAGGSASYVLTGDGGDELFGGHPVYEADKLARFIDPVPGVLKKPLLKMAGMLPDSDQKKNLTVKLKRFAESLAYPADLLSHRWRIYYQPYEIEALLTDDARTMVASEDLYADIRGYNREAEGMGHLNRSLYSDYHTVVDFYLRRNDINRRIGLETRYPMLDHELVEYCATIPEQLKIRGWFDTKYILKKAMEPVLPREIVYREDKLGHSIPLKNWMRDNPRVREFVLDYLSPSVVRRRGFFSTEYINELVRQHMDKRRNNSHRLWTLAVLEMWYQKVIDG